MSQASVQRIVAYLCSISAHWGYWETSTMLMACVAAMISSASVSIHVVTKDARSSLSWYYKGIHRSLGVRMSQSSEAIRNSRSNAAYHQQ